MRISNSMSPISTSDCHRYERSGSPPLAPAPVMEAYTRTSTKIGDSWDDIHPFAYDLNFVALARLPGGPSEWATNFAVLRSVNLVVSLRRPSKRGLSQCRCRLCPPLTGARPVSFHFLSLYCFLPLILVDVAVDSSTIDLASSVTFFTFRPVSVAVDSSTTDQAFRFHILCLLH